MEMNNTTYYFPEEISINILSRLPTVSVISCSLVCKSWRNLIVYNRDFAGMHLLRGLESHHGAFCYGRFNFLLLIDVVGNQLYYTLDDDKNDETIFRLLRWNPNPYNYKNYYVVGSCNGLICMAFDIGSSDYRDDDYEQPICICNPITREWLTLPSLTVNECCSCSTNNNNDDLKVVCGFGYLPSTDEYKVVRITYCLQEGQSPLGRVQVYTLGDGTGWRDKGEITYELEYYGRSPSILANGALHWLVKKEGKIVAFDLADEEFLFLPSPPCFLLDNDDGYIFHIQVLGGQLCAFHCKDNLTVVGVWFLKNKKKEKNGNYKDKNGQREYQFWNWIKEFDIELTDLEARHHPAPFILNEHGDVLYYRHKTLFCYDLETATSKEFMDMEECLQPDYHSLKAIIPHLNSFISLKALGEEDIKIIIESAN